MILSIAVRSAYAQLMQHPAVADDDGVLATNVTWLRQLDVSTHRVQLRAVEPDGERVLGEYTFNHSPYRPGAHL